MNNNGNLRNLNSSNVSICLNMIVKNESHVIEKTLENIMQNIPITYYVISDTGSTDNTIEVILNFFNGLGIKGEIYNDEWKDFGHNRTVALDHAFGKTDLLFIFDADDKFEGNFKWSDIENGILDYDLYMFKFGNGVGYKRPLLINNNRLKWKFVGVLHEYLSCITVETSLLKNILIEGDYYIDSGKSGDRSKDPLKYHKDAKILDDAYMDLENKEKDGDGDNEMVGLKIRYAFYCAQSYRDAGEKVKSIEWYKKRIILGGWEQEVYYSHMMIGNLYMELGEVEKAIYWWSLSLDIDPDRCECICEIMSYFRRNGKYLLAYQYYKMIEDRHKEKKIEKDFHNKLFVYKHFYEYLIDLEKMIICHHVGRFEDGINSLIYLLGKESINDIRTRVSIIESIEPYIDELFKDFNGKGRDNINKYFKFVAETYAMMRKEGYSFSGDQIGAIDKVVKKCIEICEEGKDLEVVRSKKKVIERMKIKIEKYEERKRVKILLTMTTCKRLDLFSKTVDSILSHWKDIELVDYWFCVDDNSSEDDRKIMNEKYPFFNYHFKKEEEKGHLSSMNIIWNKLNEIKPKYWIHMEDDWFFFKDDSYIMKGIKFLEKNSGDKYHQILFNKNYAEIVEDYNTVGGSVDDDGYLLHIKDEEGLVGGNCAYWPHYSFRPSILVVDTILKLGDFNSANTFFERDYADKYYACGYKSAFFNEITCKHIGRLTGHRGESDKSNAYQLNGVGQFNKEEGIKVIQFEKDEIVKFKSVIKELCEGKSINGDVDYVMIKGYDHFGDDIGTLQVKDSKELFKYCNNNQNVMAFNNLGYMKDKIKIDELKEINNNNFTLVINIKCYLEKYGNRKVNEKANEDEIEKKKADDVDFDKLFGNISKECISCDDKNKSIYKISDYCIIGDEYDEKIKNIDRMKENICKENDYVAFTSYGFFIKDFNVNNLRKCNEIFKNSIYVNIDKLKKVV